MGWLIALYASVISLINLLFATINQVFPDPLNQGYYYGGYSGGIRAAIATLVVFFPVYVLITRYLRKSFVADPSKRELWVRRWLVYLTLFLSSLAVVVDIIVLINSFLGGELSTRVLLKVLALFIVVGAVFGYYFYDLRDESFAEKKGDYFAWGSAILVIASLAWSFSVIGSPMAERERRFDDRRTNDLAQIQSQIVSFWQAKGQLPEDLGTLSDNISGFKAPLDPESKESYEYEKIGDKEFRLCATFDLPSRNEESRAYIYGPGENNNWKHDTGKTCYDRNIDEEFYPVKPEGGIKRPVPVL
ncbi:MAG: hypothetical protein HYV68_01280 [Candidatus Taylorbacteria bacterium]|nr:hypothetical protein [Candidatus Taylorbacteria bacterium]